MSDKVIDFSGKSKKGSKAEKGTDGNAKKLHPMFQTKNQKKQAKAA
jgi:hypothetical protein